MYSGRDSGQPDYERRNAQDPPKTPVVDKNTGRERHENRGVSGWIRIKARDIDELDNVRQSKERSRVQEYLPLQKLSKESGNPDQKGYDEELLQAFAKKKEIKNYKKNDDPRKTFGKENYQRINGRTFASQRIEEIKDLLVYVHPVRSRSRSYRGLL